MEKYNEDNQDIVCPFCGEADFDKSGLKGHFQNDGCEVYNSTEYKISLFRGL